MFRHSIAVDLDGVLASYERWQGPEKFGDPIPGAVEFTKQLAEFADVVIFSCRGNVACCQPYSTHELHKMMKDWLDEHGFAYHEVYVGQGKPVASAYVDDRAVVCRPQEDHTSFEQAIERSKYLCKVAK